MSSPADQLHRLSRLLQRLHGHVLAAERQYHPELAGLALLERLTQDPRWAWLRVISGLVAEIDHVLAGGHVPTTEDVGVVATRVRSLLFGEEDLRDEEFLVRYRPLLQSDLEVASIHGELRSLLKQLPSEAETESERLHARHQWTMRAKNKRSTMGE